MNQPAPARVTPYEMLGGDAIVTAIVDRFYGLIERDPAYAELRAMHDEDMSGVRKGLIQFLNAWLGGPKDWFERGLCAMSLHHKLAISGSVAIQWADAMERAISAQDGIMPELAAAMIERLRMMAMGMANREVSAT